MEEKTTSIGKVSLNYGLVASLGAIAFTMVRDIMGASSNQAVGYIWFAILLLIVFLAQNEFKKKGDGFLNYGEGVKIGIYITLISSVISSIFFYFYITAINKTFIQNMLKLQREQLEEGGMYGSELEQTMEATEKFMQPVTLILIGLVVGFIMSLIGILILTAVTQKKRPE